MIAALLLVVLAQSGQPAPPQPMPPATIDWAGLPDLPYRQPPQMTPAMHRYVGAHARVRNCRIQRRVRDKSPAIRVEVAVLVDPHDGVRTAVPRPIGCPVVEQYAAGLVTSFARHNLPSRTGAAEQWYRATLTFVWTR